MGTGCGSVHREVALTQAIVNGYYSYCLEKIKIKGKRTGNGPVKNNLD